MERKWLLSVCVAGLVAFPASLALACHLHSASVEVSCTQYKIDVTAIGVTPTHSIRYTFEVPSSSGAPALTISKTIPLTDRSGDIVDSLTNPISLVGSYDAKLLTGKASMVSSSGHTENTVDLTFSPSTLNCERPAS